MLLRRIEDECIWVDPVAPLEEAKSRFPKSFTTRDTVRAEPLPPEGEALRAAWETIYAERTRALAGALRVAFATWNDVDRALHPKRPRKAKTR